MRPMNRPTAAKGFTLIELMIAVVVVGILAAVAFPSYQEYVRKSNRAVAQSFLLDLANRQEQYLIDNRQYASASTTLSATPADVDKFYTITVGGAPTGTPPSFTLTATPKAGTAQASDVTLSINNAGSKTPSGSW